MRHTCTVLFLVVVAAAGCDSTGSGRSAAPGAPSAPTAGPPLPPVGSFPSIAVGETVRFHFDLTDQLCVGPVGRCRSYLVTPPSDGTMEVTLRPLSGDVGSLGGVELYVVPGADAWTSGPGAQIGATVPARAGVVHEIRMYAARVPSDEFELSVSMRPLALRSISTGESVRFHFDINDLQCDAAGGRCRSYVVTAPHNGTMDVAVKSVSRIFGELSGIELQVEPGGGAPRIGPGARMNLSLRVTAGAIYDIRLYSRVVPSEDLELTVSIVRDLPTVTVDEPIRFHFGPEDACPPVGLAGCRSYMVTAPVDGQMQVDLTVISGNVNAVNGLELYVVPGADFWDTGPGARIGAVVPVRAGNSYEIRMGTARVPTEELALRASMR